MAADVIEDIDYRFNDARYAWVARAPWVFSRDIPLLSPHNDSGWSLVCEGLMTTGVVRVDGKVLGKVFNQYRRWTFDLPRGARELRLEFQSIAGLQPTKLNATTQAVRQEYLSWGNNGIEDYAQMVGPFPQGQ